MNKKNLYHYTSRYQAEQIIQSGYLKLTPSNLIKPVDLRLVRYEDGYYGMVSDISDPVKPVVWLTDSLDMSGHNLECPNNPNFKKRIRITVPMKDSYKWWVTWAERNRMNKKWFRDFTYGKRYGTWYVSEQIITLDDILLIEDLVTWEVLLDNRNLNNLSA
ncbi:MAG: hypothetical protein ACI4E1_10270 [Lachnospira sp.]